MATLKLVVVGDGAVGKTSFLISFIENRFDEAYVPTVFENMAAIVEVNGVGYSVNMWDTAGQEEYTQLRPLSYPGTDLFIVCYSTIQSISLENMKDKWIPELRTYCPSALIYSVGLKTDLRTNPDILAKLKETGQKTVTLDEAKEFIKKNGLDVQGVSECSAKTHEGIVEAFQTAVGLFIEKAEQINPAIDNTKKGCSLL
ncbi:Rho GTPase, putative [Entamoeba invadens IP1]|uniref:small monomeric GTPase n=1 Tax=Entamoeba invadens IP1 TaxID=370355 RepID=A0A0A1U749_ENTIV|nr:Rho GTPase, putative [Entamoeba invadens IP1]ELP87799.1 Rho GTPase, putative [Entamoeba invadens IP1]|eukprot:XP_004254570.1 Rho GTPase, putative [Entamoeba invadens IP1]